MTEELESKLKISEKHLHSLSNIRIGKTGVKYIPSIRFKMV